MNPKGTKTSASKEFEDFGKEKLGAYANEMLRLVGRLIPHILPAQRPEINQQLQNLLGLPSEPHRAGYTNGLILEHMDGVDALEEPWESLHERLQFIETLRGIKEKQIEQVMKDPVVKSVYDLLIKCKGIVLEQKKTQSQKPEKDAELPSDEMLDIIEYVFQQCGFNTRNQYINRAGEELGEASTEISGEIVDIYTKLEKKRFNKPRIARLIFERFLLDDMRSDRLLGDDTTIISIMHYLTMLKEDEIEERVRRKKVAKNSL